MNTLKIAIGTFALIFMAWSVQAEDRKCGSQVLNCKLEKQLSTGGRSLLAETNSMFDGSNSDEPSMPADSCTIRTNLADHSGINFNVLIDDLDMMAYVYLIKNPGNGSALPGDTAFNVTAGKAFYYRYNDSLLTCTLSK